MLTRRAWIRTALGAGGALALDTRWLQGLTLGDQPGLLMRAIPGTSEMLPMVGLGSSATFAEVARSDEIAAIREVFARMVALGGRVFDTAPGYGASEEVAGRIVQELALQETLFWATKLNVARGGSADPAAARAQVEASFQRVGKPVIDLIQVHNLGDPATQLPILQEYKDQGRIRYVGITTTSESGYPQIMQIMRSGAVDFIGIDYAVDNREVEQTVLPLAMDLGIGVLVYAPFGRTRLWARVAGREVPTWASEFDATSWAQFFLKYIASHPGVTAITPATSQARNMADNMGGAMGRLPDEAMRRRMVAEVEALPQA